jgi:hypothetical protein
MQIQELSAVLDSKLAQLEQQRKTLEEQLKYAQSAAEREQLSKDLAALGQIGTKLVKSKELAWRAHDLQDNQRERSRANQRLIGLSLCVVSLLGAGLLLSFLFLN